MRSHRHPQTHPCFRIRWISLVLVLLLVGSLLKAAAAMSDPIHSSGPWGWKVRGESGLWYGIGPLLRRDRRSERGCEGLHTLPFDGRGDRGQVLGSGIHFYRIEAA